MALLNVATSYSDVSSKLALSPSTTGDYIKLYFTKDGHIITHGVDYTPWSYDSSGNKYWDIKYLPIDNTVADDKHLWDSKTIENKIAQSFIANDAMRFKGTMSQTTTSSGTTYQINGDTVTFPSSSAVTGDTYRITKAGTYAGITCEVGDLLICVTDGSSTTAATWTVAQTNINGQVAHKINNVERHFYSNDSTSFSIYAPTSAGASTQVLISSGGTSAPIWTNQSNITAGNLTDTAKKALFTAFTYSNDILSATIGGTTKTVTISGRREIKVNGTSVLASSVSTALDLRSGTGITVNWDSTNKRVNISANTGFTTNSGSHNYAVKADSNSNLYVNVPATDFIKYRDIQIGGTSIEDKALNFMPTGDIYVKTSDQNTTTTDVFDVGFGLAWYNVNTGTYEYE